jgi:glutaredoxin
MKCAFTTQGQWAVRRIKPKRKPNNTSIIMKTKAVFYHAGCPVCVAAEQNVAAALDPARFEVEIVHLGQNKARVAEAEKAGVKSVPALVLGGQAYHINFGAGIEALR